MSLFSRKSRRAGAEADAVDETPDEGLADAVDGVDDEVDEDDDAADDWPTGGLSERSQGPWDVSEVDSAEGYVDLGALRLKGREGMELRLDLEESTGRVTSATVQMGGSAVQLQVFAAPRSSGIWGEIRAEIAAGITRQGGTADDVPGIFGRELLAQLPARTPDGRSVVQPARFTGVDGPRWFLRAVFHGAAAYEATAAEDLEAVVRDVVVVRGGEAMAPRELLALRLPETGPGDQPTAGDGEDGAQDGDAQDGRPPLEPFRRGPEITEIR